MLENDEIVNEMYRESYENLDEYAEPVGTLAGLAFRKLEMEPSKYRSYLEEIVAPYLPSFQWDTAKADQQQRLFWIAVNRHEKTHPSGSLLRVLNWAREHKLHVMQVVKVLLKKR